MIMDPQALITKARSVRDKSLPTDALIDLDNLPLDVTSVPRTCGKLTSWELDITEQYDATALLGQLSTGAITAVNLLTAFQKRAAIAQQLTNCLTELIPEALAEAKARDEYLAQTGKTVGPLHGLPISLKEQISVAGHATNAGLVCWVDHVVDEDADIVRTLRRLGAVIFARTNQPQSLMHLETDNNIYGPTVNPRNRRLTAGGSTGGEAALMAMCGTPLGIGGDIGGSIRCPAALNGIYGFKPSASRISGQGVVNSLSGVDSIQGTLGPFARSLRDLVLFSKVYTEAEPWTSDVSIIPYPIGTPLTRAAGRPLRVGILTDDGVISPLPPVRSIVQDVWGKLRASSLVRVTEFLPLHHDQAWSIITANYFEGGATKIRQLCEDGSEPVLPLTDWILSTATANEAALAETPQARRAARDAFRKIYSDHWNASDVDVVMAPVTPSVAPPLGTSKSWTYTSIWNLLDYPAIAFPASEMIGGQSTDLKGQSYLPKTELEAFYYEHYDAEVAQKLPVGLQLVSKRLTENELFGAMEVIESVLKT